MTKDTVVAFCAPDGFSPDPLTDFLRLGARQLIAQAVEAELNAVSCQPCRPDRCRWPQAVGPARPLARARGSDRDRRRACEGSARP